MNQEIDIQIDKMLEKDVIQPSKSPWASGIVLVKKKDGDMRFCVDYRRLNDVTVKDAYPLPRIDDCLDQLAGNSWFSCVDLNSGYWQVEVDETDREKTAFSSRKGLFEFKVVAFGLCNAPATFERLMETVLTGLQWELCLIYLDDVIITGKTFDDMITNLSKVFYRFREAGLKLKPKKCHLFAKEVEFLGHIISADGIKTDPKKTDAIRTWPRPKCTQDVRSFLGLCSYYRRFIFDFAEIAKPLHKKGQNFEWTESCSGAFEVLKQKLIEAPILAHPDMSAQFILDTDASNDAIGAVLSQKINGNEHVIAYASRTLSKAERKYCVTRKELLALVNFVKHFKHYLYGRQFLARTDHGSLRWLLNLKNQEGQVARWLEILSAFDIKVEHRAGRLHRNADTLSRRSCKQCGQDCPISERNTPKPKQTCSLVKEEDLETKEQDLRVIQDSNRDISLVREWVEQGDRPNQKEILQESYFLKSLWSQFERLAIQDNLLVRRWDVLGTDDVNWQAIVPLSHRRLVLKHSHDIKSSGHLGIKKTLNKIRQRYYWPGLQNDVKSYVNGCEICAKRKGPTPTKKAPMQVTRSGYPMERIAVDILGELPLTERGNKYILVVSDYFTKWTESYPMPNMEASTVASLLVEQLVCRFGVPGRIHSDQGRQFESKLFTEMCRLLQIEKTRTTPYHPESDGMVERFNRTLCAMLSAYVSEEHRDWDLHLPYVMMAYRASEHETTGMSPDMLMLLRETTTPLDIVYAIPSCIKPVPTRQWVWELQEKLEGAYQFVREYTGRSIKRQKLYHDSKLNFSLLDKGDSVYVFFPVKKVGTSAKLTSFWKGPFEVKEKLSDVLYKIDCGRFGSFQVIHVDRLRKARKQISAGEELDLNKGSFLVEPEPEHEPEPDTQHVSDDLEEEVQGNKHNRRKPAWHQDYCFSTFRSDMPLTKTTPRKPQIICAVCKTEVPAGDSYENHILRVKCSECGKDFKNNDCLRKHRRNQHEKGDSKPEETASTSTGGNDSDWDVEPDVHVADPDLTMGRVVKKRTAPQPVHAASKRTATDIGVQAVDPAAVTVGLSETGPQAHPITTDKSIQVELATNQSGHSCSHCSRT